MNKRAFLFGINEYNSVAKLRFARQDAEAVARALREGYDFKENEIVLCTCGSSLKPMIKSNIFKELRCTEELDLLVVGFWGHGVWRDGKRYLCLIGTEVDALSETAISLEELYSAIQKIPAKNVCILLDCCQSRLDVARDIEAPALEEGARDIILNSFETNASKNVPDQTVAILNSCSEGQRAYEWEEKKHGYFTVHLLEELEKRESNIATIFKYVREETRKSSRERQSPFFECRGNSEILLPAVPLKTFFVPENPSDVKIVTDHKIGEINVTIQRIDLPQSAQPQALPPIPEELRRIPAEIRGIDQAIQQLKDGTHPALDPAKQAISDAKSQHDALSEKRDKFWKSLNDESLRKNVTEELQKKPDTPPRDFFRYAPSAEVQPRLHEAVLWEKHVIQARAECDRVENEYRAKCQAEIDKLKNQKKEEQNRLISRMDSFQTEVIMTVLSTFRNYDVLEISTDNLDFQWDCNSKLPELLKYNLGWEFQQLLQRAEELWKNNRPVAVREQKERDRRARKKAEAERRALKRKWTIHGICAGIILLGIVWVVMTMIRAEQERIAVEERAEAERLARELATPGRRMEKTIDGVKYAFRWCPAGSFQMGSGYDAHTVTLTQGFWMLETEVTQAMWESVMGVNPSSFKGDQLPVENVSWNDCQDFCAKLRLKGLEVSLPTEAQWEYACRAGSTGDYAGNLDEMAWYSSNSGSKTHEVGLKKPNAWGLYDMHGNVWEWCADWYDSEYYSKSPASDPTGPATGSFRVARGGSWYNDAGNCRSASRGYSSPGYRDSNLGVRLVLAVSGSGK